VCYKKNNKKLYTRQIPRFVRNGLNSKKETKPESACEVCGKINICIKQKQKQNNNDNNKNKE